MRVLLARRFRGNSNTAQLLAEEGEDQQGEVGEQRQEEEEEPVAVSLSAGQFSETQTPINPSSQQPFEKLLFSREDSCEKASSQQSRQKQNRSPQRKRRLVQSALEENDCKKQRRRKTSVSYTTKEEAAFLDKKPRAQEIEIVNKNRKRTSIDKFKSHKVLADAVENSIPAEAAPSSSVSKSASIPTSKLNPTKLSKNHKMVSGRAGQSHQRHHGNNREREEEDYLMNWHYSGNNPQRNHGFVRRLPASRDLAHAQAHAHGHEEPEQIVQSIPGFEGPLENDPASARGDLSASSPERLKHDNDRNAQNSSYSTNLVIGRREASPIGAMRNAHAPRLEIMHPSRRDTSRISPASGWERGTNSLQMISNQSGRNGSNYNDNLKRASTTAEEIRFRAALKKERGLEIREQDGDGNCLFRAISLQIYGDPSMHGDVRKQCMDHMERDREHFSQFVTGEPFLQYVARTRQEGVHGNNPEIQASSELFNRPIEVFTPENGSSPLNIFHAEYKTGDVPIRLSYHDGNHYNAVIDPLVPTAGLGLGLPGLKPGHADKMQMAKAVAESMDAAADQDETELQQVLKASQHDCSTDTDQEDELQRAIKESQLSAEHMNSNNALSLSDMDATYFELEQAALVQSLQSFSQKDEGKKRRASTTTWPRPITDDSSKPKTSGGDHKAPAVADAAPSSTTASLPCPSQESIPLAAAAASSAVASAASRENESPQRLLPVEEYPSSVQELVMNGFSLSTVGKAFDLVGDNFDHMLSLCLANANRAS